MKFLITIAIALLFFIVFIRIFENKFIFFPIKYPQGYWQPEAQGLQIENCFIQTPDGVRLHGWFVTNDSAIATLIWCHGNAGNISGRLDNLAKLANLPVNVFIFDYRGYGKSEGSPYEAGIYLDAEAAYDYIAARPKVDPTRIVIFGRSLGGAVAVNLAANRPCAGLILESTFTSAADMAKSSFGFLPVHLVIKTKLNSIEKIRSVQVPLLVLHGTDDRTVPFELGQRLFEAANEPKEFYSIQGADHNDTYVVGGKPYFEKLTEFIRRIVQTNAANKINP